MIYSKRKVLDRVLAMILSVMMVVAMFPTTPLQTTAETTDAFTVTATDGVNPVADARVVIKNNADDWTFEQTATTDTSGVASFEVQTIQNALTAATLEKAQLRIEVYADGYAYGLTAVELDAAAIAQNVTVALTAEVKLTFVKVGEGKITLDGKEVTTDTIMVEKGKDVTIAFEPADGKDAVSSMKVNGEIVADLPSAFEADTTIEVVFGTPVTFTTATNLENAGTVTHNAQGMVFAGDVVTVSAKAEDGYAIASISVISVNGNTELIAVEKNSTEKTFDVTVEEDTEVVVNFVRVFLVTIKHNDNGTVEVDNELVANEGSVSVYETNGTIAVAATPVSGYRVSQVTVNTDAAQNFTENDYAYAGTLPADKDYTIEFVFSANTYNVVVKPVEDEKGSVTVDHPTTIQHGKDLSAEVISKTGYAVSSVLVNGAEVSITEITEHEATFTVKNVTGDVQIEVTFIETEVASGGYTFTKAIRSEDGLHVYAAGKTVTFTTDKNSIRLLNENNISIGEGKTVTISKNTVVKGIALYYKAEDSKQTQWHIVEPFNSLTIAFDEKAPKAELTVDGEVDGEEKIYNSDVTVKVSWEDVNDNNDGIYTGVASASWQVECVGAETTDGVFDAAKGEGEITVDAKEYNYDNVVVKVTVTDNAGNAGTYTKNLAINSTSPEVTIEEVKSETNPIALEGHYISRTFKLTIKDRASTFDEAAAKSGFAIEAKDANGNDVTITPPIIEVTHDKTTNEDSDKDNDLHYVTVIFAEDAVYNWSYSYINKAKLSDKLELETNVAQFVVDTTDPYGALAVTLNYVEEIEEVAEDDEVESNNNTHTYKTLESELKYELWANESITMKLEAEDDTSEIAVVQYYLDYYGNDEELVLLTEEVLDKYKAWSNYNNDTGVTVDGNSRFVAYFKITDAAGNVTYIGSNGLIVDNKKPSSDLEGALEIDLTHTKEDKGELKDQLYGIDGGDKIPVEVTIYDPKYQGDKYNEYGAFSGLKDITYTITAFDHKTGEKAMSEVVTIIPTENEQKTSDYTFTGTKDGTKLFYMLEGTIYVDKATYNYNNVEVVLVAKDNAGNIAVATTELAIDITAPVITVSYGNNVADSGKYFDSDRVVTIKVTERNFDEDTFVFQYTKDGEVLKVKPEKWNKIVAEKNGDATTYTYTNDEIFAEDGDYVLGYVKNGETTKNDPYFYLADLAGTDLSEVIYATEIAPTEFTIDMTAPKVSVEYKNNSAENEKFFKEARTATIIITEHNFPIDKIEERIKFEQNVDRGSTVPTASWVHDGDTHTATFVYEFDGDYTFEMSMTDLAGNDNDPVDYGTYVAPKEFILDTTFKDMITLEGVENGVAYGHDATVIPNVKFSDINLQEYTVSLTGVQKDTTIDLSSEVTALLSGNAETVTGVFDVFQVVQNLDGIYTLKLYSKDKAGNEDSLDVVFTVNRFGSVYVYEDYLLNLVKDGGSFVQDVENDLVITEYNADKLLADSLKIEITLDGKPLENVIYSVTPEINDQVSVGSSGWYQYKYNISKDNFTADGVYKISVSSKDATGNMPENSNYEDKGMTFRVDSTKAEITSIVGLEKAIINAQAVTVKYTVFDTMGLKHIAVYVDGKMVDEITDFTADPNNYSGSFTVAEKTTAQDVRIVVEDLSGNITDTAAESFAPAYSFNGSVTVSTNIFVRWYANKGLFWGSIGGVVAVAAGVWLFLASKKKKQAQASSK